MRKPDESDVIGLAGLLAVIGGVAMWSIPAAMIVLGAVLLLYAYVTAR